MKLGLKYVEINEGSRGDLFPVINGGTWDKDSNFISEMSVPLSAADIDNSDTHSIMVSFKYIPEGMLLCLAKRTIVRGDASRSFRALWIFVPCEISLSQDEYGTLLSDTMSMLETPLAFASPMKFQESVPPMFKMDLPTSAIPSASGNMTGDALASMVYSKQYPLPKILEYGYQPEYRKFGLVILCPKPLASGKTTPLNPNTLKKLVWVYPPQKFPPQIKPDPQLRLTIDGKPMSPTGASLTTGNHEVMIYMPGFRNVGGTIKITSEDNGKPLRFGADWNNKKYLKRLEINKIHVTDEGGRTVLYQCVFHCNNTYGEMGVQKQFTINDLIYAPEDAFGNLEIKINCPGFEPATYRGNFNNPDAIHIRLKPGVGGMAPGMAAGMAQNAWPGGPSAVGRQGHNLDAPQKSQEEVRLRSRITNLENKLEAKEQKINKLSILCGILGAATVLFLILWLVKGDGGNNTEALAEEQKGDKTEQVQGSDPTDLTAAVAYLDKSSTWSKTEMDKYPDLNGLYEAVNSYDFNKIIEIGKDPILQNSTTFHSLYQQAMNSKAYVQALTGGGGEHSPKYSPNSAPINLKDYMAHVMTVSQAAMTPTNTQTQADFDQGVSHQPRVSGPRPAQRPVPVKGPQGKTQTKTPNPNPKQVKPETPKPKPETPKPNPMPKEKPSGSIRGGVD